MYNPKRAREGAVYDAMFAIFETRPDTRQHTLFDSSAADPETLTAQARAQVIAQRLGQRRTAVITAVADIQARNIAASRRRLLPEDYGD